ncbi:ribonuclease E inhibitor RraB [Nocardia terpenica]|uniref:Regulator of ribonuclease activity B domain-containing protein n=1 Tax=Nocardia terpenica TaxID=455432 RepID=A0A164HIQ4_9NOCA|nr:ribonuclease E inhibitor RraB [Nocardia terpenica]KZM68551.1 hypothetical protein AWN90_11870 [Nocardia terpenica]NQE88486.1 hypothetical protein [Nocardia terpenica]
MTGTNTTYEHFIYGPTEQALARVADELTAAGYLVLDPPDFDSWRADRDPGIGWGLTAYGSLDKAFADAGRDDIEAACTKHGARYDGGGCFIAPPNPRD